MRSRNALVALSVFALFAGCHSKGGGGTTITSSVGPVGGQLVGTGGLAGVVLTVPASSLGAVTMITASTTGSAPRSGFSATGLAVQFAPDGLMFAPPATLTLPYDPAKIPGGANAANMIVERRDGAGNVTALTPTSVDTTAHTVTVEISGFSSYWSSIATPGAPILFADYFPMGNTDTYTFTGGLTLYTIDVATPQAPLPAIPVKMLNIVDGLEMTGIALTKQSNGDLLSHGQVFEGPTTFEGISTTTEVEVHEPALFMPGSIDSDGGSGHSNYSFQVFTLPNVTTPTSSGTVDWMVIVNPGEPLTVPAGTFDDVIAVEFIETRVQSAVDGGGATDVTFVDFARGVGPIRFRSGKTQRDLIGATVGGVVIGK